MNFERNALTCVFLQESGGPHSLAARQSAVAHHGQAPQPELLEQKVAGIPRGNLIQILAFLSAPVIAFMLSSYQGLGGSFFGDQNLVHFC